jgi:hypothetical protein
MIIEFSENIYLASVTLPCQAKKGLLIVKPVIPALSEDLQAMYVMAKKRVVLHVP